MDCEMPRQWRVTRPWHEQPAALYKEHFRFHLFFTANRTERFFNWIPEELPKMKPTKWLPSDAGSFFNHKKLNYHLQTGCANRFLKIFFEGLPGEARSFLIAKRFLILFTSNLSMEIHWNATCSSSIGFTEVASQSMAWRRFKLWTALPGCPVDLQPTLRGTLRLILT